MKKILLSICSFLLFPQLSLSEEFKQVKVLNGFDSTCEQQNELQINNNRPIAINVLEKKKQGSSVQLKMELTFVKCEKNQWQSSTQQVFSFQYTDSVGQKINETISFSKFTVNILGKNDSVVYSNALSSEQNNKFIFTAKIPAKEFISGNKKDSSRFVELYITGEKSRKNAADIEPSNVNWGKIKISI